MTGEKKIRRFKCVCAYDGTDFNGWQSQPDGGSVQDLIEARLEKIFGKKTRIHASGRTDSGVHADGQVFHFDAEWKHSDAALLAALRAGLPESVLPLSLRTAGKNFHARFSVKSKRYAYKIREAKAPPKEARYVWSIGKRLDLEKLNDAAKIFLGTHDFTSFSANRGAGAKENPVKTIYSLEAKRRGKTVVIQTRGSGYLYKMVRILVGALVYASQGKFSKKDLEKILEAKARAPYGFMAAPAKGLTLEKVFYR